MSTEAKEASRQAKLGTSSGLPTKEVRNIPGIGCFDFLYFCTIVSFFLPTLLPLSAQTYTHTHTYIHTYTFIHTHTDFLLFISFLVSPPLMYFLLPPLPYSCTKR